ncbi:MAG: hypothetical protein AAB648_01660 [Patescibacteria group bacterium]
MSVEEGKFVRMFGRNEVRLTACAVTKDPEFDHMFVNFGFSDKYFREPNQFWQRDNKHERASVKFYKRDIYRHSLSHDTIQVVEIPMPFIGNDSDDSWGELQFLIKEPRLVKLARHYSFDTRVNKWVEETKPIQPKTDFGTHAYLALRFYHQDRLPQTPDNWHFEPVYVSIMSHMRFMFYRIDVFWEEEEIKITVTVLEENSPEIPKHLPTGRQV